jgi:signal transduction histidine kinase
MVEHDHNLSSKSVKSPPTIARVQESERRRLARELHDDTMQSLVALGQRLQLAQRALERSDNAGISVAVANARELSHLAMDHLRRTINLLHPNNLGVKGLISALRDLAQDIEAQGIKVQFTLEGDYRQLSSDSEIAIFRITQDALSNIVRHSHAKLVTMAVSFTQTSFTLRLQDDGIGFKLADPISDYIDAGCFGLVGMMERARAALGELNVASELGKGTTICFNLPIQPESSANS